MTTTRRFLALLLVTGMALPTVAACGKLDAAMNGTSDNAVATIATELPEEGSAQASTSFTPKPPVPTTANKDLTTQPEVHDAALNATWRFKGISNGPQRGGIVHVLLTNNNDVPLPPEAIDKPLLIVRNTAGEETVIEVLSERESGVKNGLDLPLGAHASVNLTWAVDTTPGNAYDAVLKIGDVTWEGNLGQV